MPPAPEIVKVDNVRDAYYAAIRMRGPRGWHTPMLNPYVGQNGR